MAQRRFHYDQAFEIYLRQRAIPYVAVDEAKRALHAHKRSPVSPLKSFDFVVYSSTGPNLLVDVKGRKCPSGTGGHRWENWATEDDISCLLQWQQVFGDGFRSLLVFAYHVTEPSRETEHERCHTIRNRTYAFYGVWADQYGTAMRQRSPRWQTVWLPAADFRQLRSPLTHFL